MKKSRYPVPDPNKTKINDTKETSSALKNTIKKEMTANFLEKILDVV
jgi:hypothetical protein